MICSSCHQNTTLVRIGSGEYCRLCQARQTPLPAPAPGRRSMDIRVANRPASPAAAKLAPAPKPAASLHARATPAKGRVLDLRSAVQPDKPALHPHSLAEARSKAIASQPAVLPEHSEPAAPPKATVKERDTERFHDRFERAKEVPKSKHIAKFGHEFNQPVHEGITDRQPGEPEHLNRFEDQFQEHFAPVHEESRPELPAHAVTAHQSMQHLAPSPHATHAAPSQTWRPNITGPRTSQIMTVAATIAIMGGYIWLQNYPKLAVQSASHTAGINASLPGYLPSSYNLAHTDTKPGLITFRFTSPSESETLNIQQQRTTWDSSSLLDNVIAKQTSNYSAIEGQGLTIYLYDQNQAAWINHGIWYQITGAGRLSRDQVLKIAYSL